MLLTKLYNQKKTYKSVLSHFYRGSTHTLAFWSTALRPFTSIVRLNSGIFRIFELSEGNLNLNSSDRRALKILSAYIPMSFCRSDFFFIFLRPEFLRADSDSPLDLSVNSDLTHPSFFAWDKGDGPLEHIMLNLLIFIYFQSLREECGHGVHRYDVATPWMWFSAVYALYLTDTNCEVWIAKTHWFK